MESLDFLWNPSRLESQKNPKPFFWNPLDDFWNPSDDFWNPLRDNVNFLESYFHCVIFDGVRKLHIVTWRGKHLSYYISSI